MKLRYILLNNIGIKLLALFLALVIWFYIGEATKVDSEKTVLQKLFASPNYISKSLRVKPVFVGKPAEGYGISEGEVRVDPEFVIVIGPPDTLLKREVIRTKPINLNEYTKGTAVAMELADISRSIKFEKTKVQVFIPVVKVQD